MPRILLVDDDPGIRGLMADYLVSNGLDATAAGDGAAMDRALGQAEAEERPFDLVLLDRMMPGEDGLSIARRLRDGGGPPVIILSAMGEDDQRIEGLEQGADDYLAKPVNPKELLARVRAVLRRTADPGAAAIETPMLRFAGWRLDLVQRALTSPAGVLVALTDGEFALMRTFAEGAGTVLSREHLAARMHGSQSDRFDRAIDVQVSRLRKKLERCGGEAGFGLIRTVRHEGYALASDGAAR